MKQNLKVGDDLSEQQIDFITRSINELPTPEKTILQLHFWHSYDIEEISFICDLPKTLTENLFKEAIHRLRLNYLIEFSVPKRCRGLM